MCVFFSFLQEDMGCWAHNPRTSVKGFQSVCVCVRVCACTQARGPFLLVSSDGNAGISMCSGRSWQEVLTGGFLLLLHGSFQKWL